MNRSPERNGNPRNSAASPFGKAKMLWGALAFWFLFNGASPAAEPGNFHDLRAGAVNLARDGRFREALKVEKQALQIQQSRLGPIHPSLVPILLDMGTLYRHLALYPEAEREYKWGLALLEKDGEQGPALAHALELLACLEEDQGLVQEAVLLETRSLALQKRGPSTPLSLAGSQGLLGRMKLEANRPAEAEALFQSALEGIEKSGARDPGLQMRLLDGLAQAYRVSGRPEKTGECLKQALDIAQKQPPSDGSKTADAQEKWADFLVTQGRTEKARGLYEQAFQIDRHNVGAVFDYESLPYLIRLARVEKALGRKKESEVLWEKILRTEKDIYGPEHPNVAMALVGLSRVESALGETSKAKAGLKESLQILLSHFSGNHPLVTRVRGLLRDSK